MKFKSGDRVICTQYLMMNSRLIIRNYKGIVKDCIKDNGIHHNHYEVLLLAKSILETSSLQLVLENNLQLDVQYYRDKKINALLEAL